MTWYKVVSLYFLKKSQSWYLCQFRLQSVRPNCIGHTCSRKITEVKGCQAWSLPRWVTICEYQVPYIGPTLNVFKWGFRSKTNLMSHCATVESLEYGLQSVKSFWQTPQPWFWQSSEYWKLFYTSFILEVTVSDCQVREIQYKIA